MIQIIVEGDGNFSTSRNADGARSRAELVAPDVAGGHITNEAIILPVLSLAHSGPCWSTIDDGNVVCIY